MLTLQVTAPFPIWNMGDEVLTSPVSFPALTCIYASIWFAESAKATALEGGEEGSQREAGEMEGAIGGHRGNGA